MDNKYSRAMINSAHELRGEYFVRQKNALVPGAVSNRPAYNCLATTLELVLKSILLHLSDDSLSIDYLRKDIGHNLIKLLDDIYKVKELGLADETVKVIKEISSAHMNRSFIYPLDGSYKMPDVPSIYRLESCVNEVMSVASRMIIRDTPEYKLAIGNFYISAQKKIARVGENMPNAEHRLASI